MEEKKALLREKQLDFIVEQTERFTSMVAKDYNSALVSSPSASSGCPSPAVQAVPEENAIPLQVVPEEQCNGDSMDVTNDGPPATATV